MNVFGENISINNSMLDGINNIEMIKISNKEKKYTEKISSSLSHSLTAGFKLSNTEALSTEASLLISKIFETLIIFSGAYLVLNGNLSLGELVAFTLIKDRVTQPLIRLASLWEEYCQFKLSKDRVDVVFKETSEVDTGKKVEQIHNIKFDSVSTYINKKVVVDNISFECNKGSITSIIGESGSGKSTLLKIVPKLINIDGGKVFINEENLNGINLKSLRDNIAYVGQECHIVNGTVKDNILINSSRKDDEWLSYVCRLSCCHDFILDLEEGFDTLIGEGGNNLSGGQKQRITIARCIAADRDVLLLDEPTSALDSETEQIIVSNLKEYSQDRIVLVATHRKEILNISDDVIDFTPSIK